MGDIGKAPQALPFTAVTVGDTALFAEAEDLLIRRYGKILDTYGPFSFDDFSRYYRSEMGAGLQKRFYIFEKPVSLEDAYRCKLASQEMEKRYMRGGRRRINIDPGYLTLYQLGLLTTKAFSHRSYLAEGIYTECTLIAQGSGFAPLPWTYPDYRTPGALAFFRKAKKRLKEIV